MPPSPPLLPRRARQRIPGSAAGFGLVELMIAVLIISMMMAVALPSYKRIQRKARAAALVNDLRVFATVFQAQAQETGSWPAETPAGDVPAGMTRKDMQVATWNRRTPIGGKFDWENNQNHPGGTSAGGRWRAAIAIVDTTDAPLMIDLDLYEDMDALIDDGNLATGSFRLGNGDCPLLIIEP